MPRSSHLGNDASSQYLIRCTNTAAILFSSQSFAASINCSQISWSFAVCFPKHITVHPVQQRLVMHATYHWVADKGRAVSRGRKTQHLCNAPISPQNRVELLRSEER